jgi:hypothetical protein
VDEATWLACAEPEVLLRSPTPADASRRKARLFACSCVRRIWPLLADERSRAAVLTAERLADGVADEPERQAAFEAALQACQEAPRGGAELAAANAAASVLIPYLQGIKGVPRHAREALAGGRRRLARARSAQLLAAAEAEAQAVLLRDLFGNPFRPTPVLDSAAPAWNDGAAVRLAEAIYQEHAFDRLPILADALEEAGCTDQAVLGHCRGGPHARGC